MTKAEWVVEGHRYNAYVIRCSPPPPPKAALTYAEVRAQRKREAEPRDLPPTTTVCVKCGHALDGHRSEATGGKRTCAEPGCRCPKRALEYGR